MTRRINVSNHMHTLALEMEHEGKHEQEELFDPLKSLIADNRQMWLLLVMLHNFPLAPDLLLVKCPWKTLHVLKISNTKVSLHFPTNFPHFNFSGFINNLIVQPSDKLLHKRDCTSQLRIALRNLTPTHLFCITSKPLTSSQPSDFQEIGRNPLFFFTVVNLGPRPSLFTGGIG